jgi:hypothetical protein
MKPMSIFRWSIMLLSVILFTQAASAALVELSAHFPKAEYIGQYVQLPGARQVATFSILEPDIGTSSSSGSSSGTDSIVGTWNWFTGAKVCMHPDGTLEAWKDNQKSTSGKWTGSGNKFTLNWVDGGNVDTLTLSSDGQSLDGYNQSNSHINGKKISSSDTIAGTSSSPGSTSGPNSIVGTWDWFTGTKVCMHPDGTLEAWKDNKKSNSGKWTGSGNKFTLNWVDGGNVDTLTLSSDGQSLDGYNQGGTRITGKKISSSDTL